MPRERIETDLGIDSRRSDRLLDFVRERGGDLAHHADPLAMSQRDAGLLKLGLGARPALLGVLQLTQIEYQSEAGVVVKRRHTDEDRHPAAILTEVFLFKWLQTSSRLELRQQALVLLAPFRRREIRPSEAARHEILATVADDSEKCIIGVGNSSIEVVRTDS